MLDLIIIGAGLTGLVAAYTAAKAGMQVKVVATGLGALHWSAGTVDVLGYYPDEHTPVTHPLPAIQDLAQAQPQHPYALLDGNGLQDALKSFAALTQELGWPYLGAPTQANLWLPSPVGAARPAYLAPLAQLGGELGGTRAAPMLIIGFRGLRDFFPELIADNLRKQSYAARADFLPLDLLTDRRDSNNVLLAKELDQPQRRSRLAAEVKKLVRPGERVGLPAFLGLNEHAAVVRELQAATGAAVFEIPTLPPSVPGVRLNAALRHAVEKLGGRVEVNMQVKGFHAEQGRIAWVETEASARPLEHRTNKFLLATGGLLGGGLNTDHTGRVQETCFGLPLIAPQNRGEWFRARFFDPAGQPIFGAGVPVNRQFQPVRPDGAPVYANLWAAGGSLAHADPIRERSLEGIAISTAIAAVKHLAAGR